jgi:hypothetical protein
MKRRLQQRWRRMLRWRVFLGDDGLVVRTWIALASCLRRTVPQASAGCQIRKGADHRLATVEVLRRHSLLVMFGCGDRHGLHDDCVSRRPSIRFRHAVDAALGLNGLPRGDDAGLRRGSHRARHDRSRTHTAEEHLHGRVPDTANCGRFDQLKRPPTVPAAATQLCSGTFRRVAPPTCCTGIPCCSP